MIPVLLLVSLLLLLLNAFFVLAEFASVKVRPTRVEELVDRGDPRARMLQHVQHHLDEYLSVCQVGITFASIGLGFVGKPAFQRLVQPPLEWLGWASPAVTGAVAVSLAYLLVSFLHILVGELVPKSIAIRRAEASGLWMALPLRVCHFLFFVPFWILNSSANLILRLIGLPELIKDPTHTEDEIRIILERSQSGGVISFLRLLMMENVFDFGTMRVRDAMKPPAAVKIIRLRAPWSENLRAIRESKYSRFPVVDEGQDLPIGVVHVKDLLHMDLTRQDSPDLRAVLRPYLKVTDELPLEEMLSRFQRQRRRVAVVVDRKGRWTGFLTLEDVIEEIVGSVEDEFEKEPPLFLADVLTAGRIVFGVRGGNMVEAIADILGRIDAAELPQPRDKVVRAVVERERTLQTYLGEGVAVPHARLDGIDGPCLIVASAEQGIPVRGGAERAHVIFMLLTPLAAPQFQVRLLSRIAGLTRSEYVVERLREARDPAAVLEVIRAADPVSLG
jgi:CBS domain containing-hemolysin-like protein